MSLDDDFAHRELCPDGACIGVIGPDGRCKVCGTVSPTAVSDPRNAAFTPPATPAIATADDDASGRGGGDGDADEFDHRELCADDACIGVLGPDRRCKVCGRLAGGPPG